MKKYLQFVLKILAKAILYRYRPKVVGITGSVGKTSAKEAIYAVLSREFRVRRNLKNYNNEIGLPLSIIGAGSEGRSIAGWLKVFSRAIRMILVRDEDYPEVLVLEMGIDRPGDMEYLLSIVRPDVGVITAIGQSHLEFFGTADKVKEEKGTLVRTLPATAWAVLNHDDEKAGSLGGRSKAQVIFYGFGDGASIRALDYKGSAEKDGRAGVSFKLDYRGQPAEIFIPGMLGRTSVYSALAACAVAFSFAMDIGKVMEGLRGFKLPNGRLNLIPGMNVSAVIDDTYNASPQSAAAALEALEETGKSGRHVAVLGDMLELGSYEEDGHKAVGKKAAETGVDILVSVGEKARNIFLGAEEAGMGKERNHYFESKEKALPFIKGLITPGDIILVKGSQGARMEKIVKEIMAEPEKADGSLVRQEKGWQKDR